MSLGTTAAQNAGTGGACAPRTRGVLELLLRGVGLADADVVADSAAEEQRLLADQAHLPSRNGKRFRKGVNADERHE